MVFAAHRKAGTTAFSRPLVLVSGHMVRLAVLDRWVLGRLEVAG